MKTEEKAKIILAAVRGAEFAARAILHRTIFQIILVQFILLFKYSSAKQLAQQGME